MSKIQTIQNDSKSFEYGVYTIEPNGQGSGWWIVRKDDSLLAHTPSQAEARRVVWLDMVDDAGATKEMSKDERLELLLNNGIPLFLDEHHFTPVGCF